MIITDFAEFVGVTRGKRLLGLDIGKKTIGLALSDSLHTVATPDYTLKRRKFTQDADQLIAYINEHEPGGLVVGLPLNMDGSEGPTCQSVRQFIRNLLALHKLPVWFQDERLSTVAVERDMITADLSRAKRAEKIDAAAASYILQGVLDRMSHIQSD